jgi:hypothetical protein
MNDDPIGQSKARRRNCFCETERRQRMAEGFQFRACCGMDRAADTGARAQILVGRIDDCIAIHLLDDIAKADANLDWRPLLSVFNHSSILFRSRLLTGGSFP